MTYKKKLIEVALPLDAINKASAREKSRSIGHPASLHGWWARRPLASTRAVIWASLVDDPSAHPDQFPDEAAQNTERQRLFKILEDLVIWENTNNQKVLAAAKKEILKSTNNNPPPLLDPFAGGGAIPLEAQRLGLESYASDLNPVAVMINKAMIEIPPKYKDKQPINPLVKNKISTWSGMDGLVDDISYYGQWMKNRAYEKIGHLYPLAIDKSGNKHNVIAWLWTRTVKCPNPVCGVNMPLANSFVLSKRKNKETYVKPKLQNKNFFYQVKSGTDAPESPKIGRGRFKCVSCNEVTPIEHIRNEFQFKRSGVQLMAIAAESRGGRLYISPTEEHINAANCGEPAWKPDQPMNMDSTDLVSGRGYGFTHWHELFTQRQLVALSTFSELVNDCIEEAKKDGASEEYANAIGLYLSLVVSKLTAYHSSFSAWHTTGESIQGVFGRQAIPMIWDFAEANFFSNSSGCFDNMLNLVVKSLTVFSGQTKSFAFQHDAQVDNGMRGLLISTDPPYYDNIAYADLSDFYFVWLRKTLANQYPNLFSTLLTPKEAELVANSYRFGGGAQEAKEFFEDGMFQTFIQINKMANDDYPMTVFYAYRQSETLDVEGKKATASTGWDTMLTGLIRAGFSITGTWPMRTEMAVRATARSGTNTLASSIILVCRKRSEDAPVTTYRNFINVLKHELRPALEKLQLSNLAPVDLAQTAIGPGIGVYSRYAQVLEADGTPMSVRTALQIINQELDSFFNEQDGELDSASRFCVDLFTQSAFNEIRYGDADVLARAKNTSVERLAEDGVLLAEKGIVRLLTREELPDFIWAKKGMVWMLTQQLTKAMETGGYQATAKILAALPASKVEQAKALAYRLFSLADRKGWAKEAYAYNTLVSSWQSVQFTASEIAKTASEPKQINWLEQND